MDIPAEYKDDPDLYRALMASLEGAGDGSGVAEPSPD